MFIYVNKAVTMAHQQLHILQRQRSFIDTKRRDGHKVRQREKVGQPIEEEEGQLRRVCASEGGQKISVQH